MPATDADLKYYLGANGAPTNDTDPIGGAIDTGTPLNEASLDIVIKALSVPTSANEVYRGIAYRKNEHASSNWAGAKFCNRAGALLNTVSGVASIVSTNPADTGSVRVVGKKSSVWAPETLVAAGPTTVYGSTIFDTSSVYRWEYTVGGVPAVPQGNLTCAIDGVIYAVIYGGAQGNVMASAESELAVATAKDATISATNRKTDPASGISAFSRAVKWTGSDQSIAVPGNVLEFGKWIGYCIRLTAVANIPQPIGGAVVVDIDLLGNGT